MFRGSSRGRSKWLATAAGAILLLLLAWYAATSRPAYGGTRDVGLGRPDPSNPNYGQIWLKPGESVIQTQNLSDGGEMVVRASNGNDDSTDGDQTSSSP